MAVETANQAIGGGGILKPRPRPIGMNHGPSICASIPSQYQTFFYANTEKEGFNCKTTRFQDLDVEDNPGPGTYIPELDSFEDKSASFSNRGTGGFASKNERFSRIRHQKLGPGSYDPQLINNHRDFNRAEVSSNFHSPIAVKTDTDHLAPAPNSYNLDNIRTGRNKLITAEAVFNSKTHHRDITNAHSLKTPAPDKYTITDHLLHPSTWSYKSVFKSKTNRVFTKPQKGPGPADYSPSYNKQQCKIHPYRQKHYLCFSAPALPLPPIPPPPGPGHYEVQDNMVKDKSKSSGIAFKSTSSRWMCSNSTDEPGPGSYYPTSEGKRSYLYNARNKWV